MRSGRPPMWNIAEGFSEDVWTGVAEVTQDRLLIPRARARSVACTWRGSDGSRGNKGNAVELRPWEDNGAVLVRRLAEVAGTLSGTRRQDLVINDGRFARLSIGSDGRTVLPVTFRTTGAHLSNAIGIVVREGAIWLWSSRMDWQPARTVFRFGHAASGRASRRLALQRSDYPFDSGVRHKPRWTAP